MPELILSYFYNSNDFVKKSITTSDGFSTYSLQCPVYSDYKRLNLLGHLTSQGTTTSIDKELPDFDVIINVAHNILINDSQDSFTYYIGGAYDGTIFKKQETRIYRIIGGQGIYTFTNGYVVFNIFEKGDRICYVYATN